MSTDYVQDPGMPVQKYARYCAPCAGTDATRDNVLAVRGACQLCGYDARGEGVELFRAPKRLAPGLEATT